MLALASRIKCFFDLLLLAGVPSGIEHGAVDTLRLAPSLALTSRANGFGAAAFHFAGSTVVAGQGDAGAFALSRAPICVDL